MDVLVPIPIPLPFRFDRDPFTRTFDADIYDHDLAADWPLPVSAISSRDASARTWAALFTHLH